MCLEKKNKTRQAEIKTEKYFDVYTFFFLKKKSDSYNQSGHNVFLDKSISDT